MDAESPDPTQQALDETSAELSRLLTTEDPNDPETHYHVCALQVRRYGLLVLQSQGNWMDEDKYQRTLQEWSKRLASAEAHRKNRLLPQIMARLEQLQGTSSAIQEHANNAQFWADDE